MGEFWRGRALGRLVLHALTANVDPNFPSWHHVMAPACRMLVGRGDVIFVLSQIWALPRDWARVLRGVKKAAEILAQRPRSSALSPPRRTVQGVPPRPAEMGGSLGAAKCGGGGPVRGSLGKGAGGVWAAACGLLAPPSSRMLGLAPAMGATQQTQWSGGTNFAIGIKATPLAVGIIYRIATSLPLPTAESAHCHRSWPSWHPGGCAEGVPGRDAVVVGCGRGAGVQIDTGECGGQGEHKGVLALPWTAVSCRTGMITHSVPVRRAAASLFQVRNTLRLLCRITENIKYSAIGKPGNNKTDMI